MMYSFPLCTPHPDGSYSEHGREMFDEEVDPTPKSKRGDERKKPVLVVQIMYACMKLCSSPFSCCAILPRGLVSSVL